MMVVLAVFVIILGLGVILTLWSMREYGPGKSKGEAEALQVDFRAEKREKGAKGAKRVSLKGEIVLSPKKKEV